MTISHVRTTFIGSGLPECDEQEDEEDGCFLSSFVVRALILCLQSTLEAQRHDQAGQACEQECSPAELIDIKGCKDVARERCRDPEGSKQQWHIACHSKISINEHSIVGDDEHASELRLRSTCAHT